MDEDKKAIYPYYFIENRMKITKAFLIKLYPELKDDKRCEELINKAYKFIGEYNENKKNNFKKL